MYWCKHHSISSSEGYNDKAAERTLNKILKWIKFFVPCGSFVSTSGNSTIKASRIPTKITQYDGPDEELWS